MQSKFAIDFIYIEKQYDLSGYPGGPDINLEPEHAEKLLLSKKKQTVNMKWLRQDLNQEPFNHWLNDHCPWDTTCTC